MNKTNTIIFSLAIALCAVAILLPNRYALTVFHEANSAGRVYAVHSYVHYGTWSLAPVLCRTGPRHSIVDMAAKDGVPYLQKAPGNSWFGIPIYALISKIAGGIRLPFHWTAMILGLLTVGLPLVGAGFVLFRRWGASIGQRAAALAVVTMLLASPIHTYSGMFQDYPLAVAFLMLGWALASGGFVFALLAGLLLGAAGVTNYAFFVYGFVVALIEWGRRLIQGDHPWRFALACVAGFSVPLGALLIYNTVLFGGPFTTAYAFLIDPGQRHTSSNLGFSFEALKRTLVGPRHGIFTTAPWTIIGVIGLIHALSKKHLQWTAITGFGVIFAVLGFATIWGRSNVDDMAFHRHILAVFPWLAWGFAYAIASLMKSGSALGRGIVGFGAAGLVVGWFVNLATSWTFPYHDFRLPSPIWQLNVPLLFSEAHLPSIVGYLFSPWHIPGRSTAGAHWSPIMVSIVAAGLAFALIAIGHGTPTRLQPTPRTAKALQKRRMRPWAFTASFMASLFLLFGLGIISCPVSSETLQWARTVTPEQRDRLDPETRKAYELAKMENREFDSAYTDIVGSSFTPQDVFWKEDGYPETNRWCDVTDLRRPIPKTQ
ncbi:MAG TPA: hypothetical protein PK329_00895 [Myxococcota bacterium]|nr:hypothetical protein [Myxococcota bacterium]HON24742.1 hypothetical protein [Myxococcota bacterium]HOS62133.1 hypothetical protein [Myxococcota bacterium]HPC91953.1 hypothetical protein [Myxococcota bacterium]HPL24864.1 hypothetical protein [Myxococcota bacterium]